MDERDKAKVIADAADKEVRTIIDELELKGVYTYTSTEDILEKLKNKEIEDRHPAIDIDAALDDLIIESVEDDFSVDAFIEHYLEQVRNG